MFAKITQSFLLLSVFMLAACGSPDFVDSEGKELSWEDFKGEQLVINYWAEWCKPCVEEIPELNELYHENKDKGIAVLGVNFDRPKLEKLKAQMLALNVEFPVIHSDPDGQLDYLLPPVLPTTYIFGPDGELKHKLVGPQTKTSIQAVLSFE